MEHASLSLNTGRSIQTLVVSTCLLRRPGNLLMVFFVDRCQGAVARPIVWVTFISSVLTDIYLIMIPIPMLWGTKLKLAKKIAATIVLGAGVFVLICSLLKTIFVIVVSQCTHPPHQSIVSNVTYRMPPMAQSLLADGAHGKPSSRSSPPIFP